MNGRVRCSIDAAVRRRVPRAAQARVVRDVARLVRFVGGAEASVELVLCNDAAMARLHAQHFGDAKPTDVLSFPAGPAMPGAPEGDLGQIVVNVDAVARQAIGGWEAEVRSLCIHSVAHLVGHDHDVPTAARAMLRAERRLGRHLGTAVRRPYGGRG
jgi:probable rRNA maturation factor